MKTVTESIFDGKDVVVPLADVQHIEKHWFDGDNRETEPHRGINIITKHTKWNLEIDFWENPIYVSNCDNGDAKEFMKAWQVYRMELESCTLKDISPMGIK